MSGSGSSRLGGGCGFGQDCLRGCPSPSLFKMFCKESCGKKEKSPRKGTTSSPYFGEKDKKEKKTSASSASSALRSVPSEKRKLNSDHTDILYYRTNRRQELKRLNVEIDALKKRPKISSSSQGSVKFQETSYSNDNQIISKSPSSNGNKKDTSKCIDFKLKDIKFTNVRSKFDHGIKNLSSPMIASDVKPQAEGQADEKKWMHLRAQREKMKELKKERNRRFRDSSEKYVLEKCKKNQVSQDYNSNKIIKEHLESRRKSFEAPCSSGSSENIQDTDQEMQIVEELHAARVGKSLDLPLVPPSGELMSMEIDLVEDDVHSSAGNTPLDKKLLIVIDTNILMNHLKFVRVLKTTEMPGFDKLVLIIPWVVMQELDRMKAGKLLKHAQHKAIPAVHFINDSLKNQDRKLWGQSIQLASQKLYGLSDENNDDRVLKCCLQHQELFPCSLVILCTDDRNLRNKGLISGVKSLSKEELSAELLNLSLNTDACHQLCISKQQVKAEATLLEESYEKESTNSGLSILLESIVSDLEKSLGTALSSILETEMKMAFGNLWMEMLYLKPPWTLIHLLQCFKKHWLAVFGLVMEKNLLLTVESLYENLHKANNTVDFTTVKFLLQDSKSLLHAFSRRSNYDGILPQAFAQVNKLLQTFAKVKTKPKPNSSENTVSENQEDTSSVKSHNQEMAVFSDSHLPQPNRHQEIWSILENVWITIYQNSMDVFERLGSNSAQTTSKIASFEEAFIYLQKLMAAVKDILEGIQRILAPNSNFQDVETLYNFLIKYEVNKNVTFTAQELYDCVSQTEYREKLTIGCCQLVEMDYTMQQCKASVYMEATKRGWCEDMLSYRT
ncbi:transcriptional protein SWT1 isoform X3 [Nycticebus coucang]|uniref:transcriptional protein SWT1 isoform X3 n=1 Tax=Nycticebus coucang TaxID=9470 RepID=UPI00234D8D87|nr:transcriptional protein SWT1 isoform X3 [Nycticebus coucang]